MLRLCYALGLALAAIGLGCAGHEARLASTFDALDRGATAEALTTLDEELEVKDPEELPADLDGDNALLVLERATVKQSLERYKSSAKDFGAADKAIEVLDLSASAADDIGRYLFSDSVGRYRAPAFEKLLINTFNAMNYLAVRDLSGAKVEARRLAVMQRYLKEQKDSTPLLGLGSYLAGFAFEKAGEPDEAMGYYEDALQFSLYPSLRDPVRVLTQGQPKSKTIDALVAGAGALPSLAEAGESELLVVVGYGRVPPKLPVRLPIGVALSLVAHDLSPQNHKMALALAAKGLVTWVNFPRLGKSRGANAVPELWIDGRPTALDHALNIEAEVRKEWDSNEGFVILAAITRLLTRAAAGELVGAATNAAADNERGLIGLFAGLATTAALAAADTPDTRSWATLPAEVALARLRLPPGAHRIRLSARGAVREEQITIQAGDWAFVCLTALR
jgi:uncharacterized protein